MELSKDCAKVFKFVKELNAKYRGGGELSVGTTGKYIATEFHFGQLDHHQRLRFSALDLFKLNQEITQLTGKNPAWDDYIKVTRPERSKSHNSTKLQTLPVREDFVLVNCLGSLKINQQISVSLTLSSLGVHLNVNDFNSIEHRQLILVENLAVMASLALLKLPAEIDDPLFIYRGDVKSEQNTRTAYQFFRRWSSSHQLICFSDFDPAGMVIVISSGATSCLIPEPTSWDYIFSVKLKDVEKNWWQQNKQMTALSSLVKQDQLPKELAAGFKNMGDYRRTWQQEHMISHQTPLTLSAL